MPECVPCNACPAPGGGGGGGPCPCRTCCCGKTPTVNPCYKQPRIPDSYAPRRCYVKPTAPVEGCTTYKMSYLPTADSKNLRGVARKPSPNLVPSCEPMEGCTVQKLSFLPNPVCVTQPIRPCHHDMWGQGPMQAITTQRHDYVPKPSVLRESCKPPPKFHSVEQPFESMPKSQNVLSSKDLTPKASKVDSVKKPSESTLSSKELASVATTQVSPQVETVKKWFGRKSQALSNQGTLSFFDTSLMPFRATQIDGVNKSFKRKRPSQNSTVSSQGTLSLLSTPQTLIVPAQTTSQADSVGKSFRHRTVNKLSYLPPERVPMVKSFAPERCYEKPVARMEGSTTQKMSYMPVPINPKEPLPWACRGQYQKPCQKLDTATTYAMSFLNAESDCRRRAIIPDSCNNPVTASKRFETQTIYKNSFLPATTPIPAPVRPVPNLLPSTALMDGDTVQKLSFLPNPVCVTQPIRPCHHDMWGQGPMQVVTTQRHDYVPKPSAIRESCKPPPKFHSVESPFENRTVNRMSYINPGPAPPAASFAPVKCYEKPAAKMENSTTHKLSYQPVCAPSPQRPPWACKGQYQKPCQKIDATTVYRSSFLPPGEDCSQVIDPCSYGDCKPCDCTCPAECIATDPCACVFPKAACCS